MLKLGKYFKSFIYSTFFAIECLVVALAALTVGFAVIIITCKILGINLDK